MLRALHKYSGLLLGAVLTLIGLSGSLLVFDHALDEAITPALRGLPMESSAPLETVLQNAVQAAPDTTVATRIDLARQPGSPHTVRFACQPPQNCLLEASVDPASGRVLAVREWGRYPMSWLYAFHYTLLSGSVGKTVVGSLGIVLVFFLASGVYLWWPRRGRWRQAFRIRRQPTVRFLRELHQVIGVITVPLLLVCALSGVTMVFRAPIQSAIEWVLTVEPKPDYRVTVSDDALATDALSLDAQVRIVQAAFPHGELKRIFLPRHDHEPTQVRLNLPGEAWRNHGASAVWVDPYAGRVLGVWNAGQEPLGNALLTWAFPLHNADVLGLPGRILWLGVGLLPGVLFVTGLLFWTRAARLRSTRRG